MSDQELNQIEPNPVQKSNKKLFIAIGALFAVLLVVLIILFALVLTKDNDDANNNNEQTQNSQQNNGQDDNSQPAQKKIVKTVNTNENNVQLIMYEPQQSAGNTKFNFALKNTCGNCGDDEMFVNGNAILDFRSNTPEDVYAVDNNSSQKYGVVVDKGANEDSENDDKSLISANCSGRLKRGEQIDCFATMAKIPSGSTVSVVLGGSSPSIDGILIP